MLMQYLVETWRGTICSTVMSSFLLLTSLVPLLASIMRTSSSFWIAQGIFPPGDGPFLSSPSFWRQLFDVATHLAWMIWGKPRQDSIRHVSRHLQTWDLPTMSGNFSLQSFWRFLFAFFLSRFFFSKKTCKSALVFPNGLGSFNSSMALYFSFRNSSYKSRTLSFCSMVTRRRGARRGLENTPPSIVCLFLTFFVDPVELFAFTNFFACHNCRLLRLGYIQLL